MLFLYEGNVWFIIEKYKNLTAISDDDSSLNTSYYSDDDLEKSVLSKITSHKKLSNINLKVNPSAWDKSKDQNFLKLGTYVNRK